MTEKEALELSAEDKYHLTRQVITKYTLKNMLSYLCSLSGTSRSGYYRYFSKKGKESRRKREERKEELRKTIQNAYDFKR
ncbi:hypothetical protein SAMN05421804_102130 [Proteiniclasticum ruminis]|uniref:Transposase n=1 Tax=Proteiniclasticum ruminis TaxID=398199 RepID=A0A1G8JWP3_9CLOT|nr:hypothetical protein SAMN05421804_102130 [Proteiniclasticum ruminis]